MTALLVLAFLAHEGYYVYLQRSERVEAVSFPATASYSDSLAATARLLGCEPVWLWSVIELESGHNPQATNRASGATGLIQWLPDTAKGYGLSCDSIRAMSATAQLELVHTYLVRFAPFRSKADLYWCIFYPAARHQAPNYVLGSGAEAKRIAEQNRGFDLNGDGIVEKKEVETKLEGK